MRECIVDFLIATYNAESLEIYEHYATLQLFTMSLNTLQNVKRGCIRNYKLCMKC